MKLQLPVGRPRVCLVRGLCVVMHASLCACVCVCLYVHVHVHVCVRVYGWICQFVCLSLRVCSCACMCIFACVYMVAYASVCV